MVSWENAVYDQHMYIFHEQNFTCALTFTWDNFVKVKVRLRIQIRLRQVTWTELRAG